MENFYTLLANTGINAIMSARASNSEVKLTKIAVGDGDIIPSQDMTALKSEKHRFNINSIIQDVDNPNYLIIEGVIPSNVGGFYVSEVAIYTDQNILFAIGSLPKTYKPLLEEGSAKDLTIKIFLEITNADSVTLKVDDSVVLATRKFVLSELKKYALINGDETKKFKVADAENDDEAVNKKQLDGLFSQIDISLSDFTGSNHNLTENGYQMLPKDPITGDCLILQWGRVADYSFQADVGIKTIVFPVAFPSSVLNISLGQTTKNNNPDAFWNVDNTNTPPTNTGFICRSGSTVAGGTFQGFYWFAVGK